MLHKKVCIATITKKTHRHLSKGIYSRKASILIALWTNYEGILSQIALYPITGLIIQTANKNVFILTLSRTEVVKKLAY